jgi:hypothetical protein
MPPSLTPGSSIVVSVQYIDVDIGLRHGPKGSALPMIPHFSVVRAHSWNIARRSLFSLANWARMGVADRQPRILDPHFENISPRRLRS